MSSERAADMLVYYFRLALTRAGVQWNEDNEAEIRGIVDSLDNHIRDEIHRHRDDAPHSHPHGGRP